MAFFTSAILISKLLKDARDLLSANTGLAPGLRTFLTRTSLLGT